MEKDAVSSSFQRAGTVSVRPALQRGLTRRSLLQARAFMERNLGRGLTLGDIAKAACVSRFHFARLFRVSTGHSPMRYLLKLRIERAKVLLTRSDDPVSAIANVLGFCDQSHFTRVFRRCVGLTPGQFARSMRKHSWMKFPHRYGAERDERHHDEDLCHEKWRLGLHRCERLQEWQLLERLHDPDENVQIESKHRTDDVDPTRDAREVIGVKGDDCNRKRHQRDDADDVGRSEARRVKQKPGRAGGDRGCEK
jgi:AraC-like DNA-binding protein